MHYRGALALLLVAILAMGACAGRHRGPRVLAGIGTALAIGGGVSWTVGERSDRDPLVTGGVITSVVGLAAILIAGGWLVTRIGCTADPDCHETEECREIPAPPGGVPYKQCMAR